MGNNTTKGIEVKLSNVHFVLKTPLRPPFPEGSAQACFATGCFWGTEKGYWRMPGVFSTAVGYVGGKKDAVHPSYEEVCSGATGHTEAVFVVYDPAKVAYADLLRQFYESHNPTQVNGQGGDSGTQYRGGIYTFDEDQTKLASASKGAYSAVLGKTLATEIRPMAEAGPFYYAEEYHQQYLAKPGNRQYCSAEPQGKSLLPTWLPADFGKHAPKLPEEYWRQYAPKPGCVIKGPNSQISFP